MKHEVLVEGTKIYGKAAILVTSKVLIWKIRPTLSFSQTSAIPTKLHA